MRPEETERKTVPPELRDLINLQFDKPAIFGLGKTLGDIQDFIVKMSVDTGCHPSNLMDEAIAKGYLRDNPGVQDIQNKYGPLKKNDPEKRERLMVKEQEKIDAKIGTFMEKGDFCDDPKKRNKSVEKSVADE